MKAPRPPKIKLVRVIARLNVGGTAIHVINLAAGLDQDRFEQILVSGTENPGEGSMVEYALSRGVRPHIIPEMVGEATFKPRDVRAVLKLYRLLRRERPHIVDTHTAKAGFVGRVAARMARVPVVIHTYHGHVLHGYYGRVKSVLLRRMEQGLALMTDRMVTISEQVKRDLVAYGVAPARKITVIPLGIDLAPFLCAASHRGELRRELGIQDGARLVGIVGRIFPIKNHRLFLDAAARVAAQAPDARFVIVGDGILRDEMERHARDLGIAHRVLFTGWRQDLPLVYADLDVLVVSSNNEGTPISAIEAMASGCPVVSTRVGGVPDMMVDGETGYLTPPGDADRLSSGVLRVLRDRDASSEVGRRARQAAQAHFSLQRLIADTERLYDELLAAKGKLPHAPKMV